MGKGKQGKTVIGLFPPPRPTPLSYEYWDMTQADDGEVLRSGEPLGCLREPSSILSRVIYSLLSFVSFSFFLRLRCYVDQCG